MARASDRRKPRKTVGLDDLFRLVFLVAYPCFQSLLSPQFPWFQKNHDESVRCLNFVHRQIVYRQLNYYVNNALVILGYTIEMGVCALGPCRDQFNCSLLGQIIEQDNLHRCEERLYIGNLSFNPF